MLIFKIIKKIFGTRNDKLINKFIKIVQKINSLEQTIKHYSDYEIRHLYTSYKNNIKDHSQLNDILINIFSFVREIAIRTIKIRHFDVQMIGGIVLHEGKISEMQTGEGKTIVATLTTCLNSLYKNGIHIITVNEYLAKRDSSWMYPIYNLLGLKIGTLTQNTNLSERKIIYLSDIIYGTNNEFAFDYLKDNMVYTLEDKVQQELFFAIIDEIDSILIDEARTPLIISGIDKNSSDIYLKINNIVKLLKKNDSYNSNEDYIINEKEKNITLTEKGHIHVENLLIKNFILDENSNLYDLKNISLIHYINTSIKAHALFKKNIDYIIKDNKILIIDEHTGRIMHGKRWSDGLHQAIEAKEGVEIESENQTLATITFQNYFRMYNKLCGMTGTASTEAYEFKEIYNLETIIIPSNKKCIRIDYPDKIYLTKEEKYDKIIEDIYEKFILQRPILIGTISIELSEHMSFLLHQKNIKHEILNAKFHEKEAYIIADAGKLNSVTIATNMAGRGTDIVLGGKIKYMNDDSFLLKKWKIDNENVISLGGLYVIGTERHESRRIDNQLRGRAGRQGDPGSSQFYLSINDDLMKLFLSQNLSLLLKKIGMKKGEAITHSWVNRAIENAQKKIEGYNFDLRKQLLEFDDVIDKQRKIIYQQRDEIIKHNDINLLTTIIIEDIISDLIKINIFNKEINYNDCINLFYKEFNYFLQITEKQYYEYNNYDEKSCNNFTKNILNEIITYYNNNKNFLIEKNLFLSIIDNHWKEHLYDIEQLKKYIHLRGYAQKDPKQEYKKEAFYMFTNIINDIKKDYIKTIFKININIEEMNSIYQENNIFSESKKKNNNVNIKNNDLCFCGSKKKYKHCHKNI